MASIGNLSATITANGQQFINEFHRADNQARRASASISGSLAKIQKGMGGAFARGGLKALGLAEFASLARNELRTIISDFESIKGISPEAKDSIYQFGEALSGLRQNVRGLLAEGIAGLQGVMDRVGATVAGFFYDSSVVEQSLADLRNESRTGREAAAAAKAAEKMADEMKRLNAELAVAEKSAGKAMQGIAGAMVEPAEQAEALNARLGRIMNELGYADASTPDGIKKRIELLNDMTRTAGSLEKVNARIRDLMEEQTRWAKEVGGALSASFENAVFSGGKLRDMLRDIANDLLRLIFRQTITEPLAGFISSGLGSIFGGGKAGGGMVAAGTSYLVGERGPEVFTPKASGSIIPNHRLAGAVAGESITIINNVQAGVSRAELIPALNATSEATIARIRDMDRRRK